MHESEAISYSKFIKTVLDDFYLSHISRQLSILGSKNIKMGSNKSGDFGDGKEIAQVALAKYFRDGDWHSGYSHDLAFMFATDMASPEEYFEMLYGKADLEHSGGRNFINHLYTRLINEDGTWKPVSKIKNSSSNITASAALMPHLIGLAHASKIYRYSFPKRENQLFSNNGNEVAFGTIDEYTASENHFLITLKDACDLQVPLALVIWDNSYEISNITEFQKTKNNISETLKVFLKDTGSNKILIYKAKGWDYPNLCKTFATGIDHCRKEHVPVVFHITELIQPIGKLTPGGHKHYKSHENKVWEQQHDPLIKFRQWIIEKQISTNTELDLLEHKAVKDAQIARNNAYKTYTDQIIEEKNDLLRILKHKSCLCKNDHIDKLEIIAENIRNIKFPLRKDIVSSARKILRVLCNDCAVRKELQTNLIQWIEKQQINSTFRYSSNLYCETAQSALNVLPIPPVFNDESLLVYGHEIVRANFDFLLQKYPNMLIVGDDVGPDGSGETFNGLQKKYGDIRINENYKDSIIGQSIGLAMRGFKVIVDIQYFDRLLNELQTLSNDLATLHWRSKGRQVAPLIINTRGLNNNRLSELINSIRGIYVCVPRNMTQAAGFYNTLMKGQDPAIVIEPKRGYYLKERKPENTGEYCIPLGIPEILYEGEDITLVTYGSCVGIATGAIEQLAEHGISVELIDVQTLLPFDLNNTIFKSISKTHRVVFFDEDIPGGTTAYMMQKAIEEQGIWQHLDTAPKTITAMEHRALHNIDENYFSSPTVEDIFETIYRMMSEAKPDKYPKIF